MTAFPVKSHLFRPVTALAPALALCLALFFAPFSPSLAATVSSTDPGALREAIAGAVDGETIDFSIGDTNTIFLGGTGPRGFMFRLTANNLTIDGTNGGAGVILDGSDGAGGNNMGFFQSTSSVDTLTLDNLTLQNGSFNFGGAIYTSDALTITTGEGGVTFSDNSANLNGGAISAHERLVITTTGEGGVTFSDNFVTSGEGGAISALERLEIGGNTLFINNSAEYNGGAIYAASDVTLDAGGTGDIHFTGNTADGTPNAIDMWSGTLTLAGDRAVVFDDPLSTSNTNSNNFLISSANLAQFDGNSTLSGDYYGGEATVAGGEFRILSDASFATGGTAESASFILNSGATLSGAGTIITPGDITLNGTIDPTGNRYTPDSSSLANQGTFSEGKDIATLYLEGGTVYLDGATLKIDTAENNASDTVSVTGDVEFSGYSNTVYVIGGFREGEYSIMEWTGDQAGNADDFGITSQTAFNSREIASLSINDKQLFLSMAMPNTSLTWTGTRGCL